MSKAFTRESDDGGGQEISSLRPRLPGGARNHITKAGAERLRRQLDELIGKRRALADGVGELDPTSNAESQRLEAAIRKLQVILDSVVVAEPPADRGKIAFGALVRLRRGDGAEDEYQIVGVDETDLESGRISWMSPLAKVLLSRNPGETVRFHSPAGPEDLTILDVRYPPG